MSMFCFQCQETARNVGCTVRGVCGKTPETARKMDELLQQLKVMALTCSPDRERGLFMIQSLFMTITNANFDEAAITAQLERARVLTGAADATAPLGVLSCENEDIRSLRELLTYGLKGIAAYADHAAMLGREDDEIYAFLFKALAATTKDLAAEELIALVIECGHMAVKTMALLDAANTEAYGHPKMTRVRTGVGKRPGILISGHDLRDLKELLDQIYGRNAAFPESSRQRAEELADEFCQTFLGNGDPAGQEVRQALNGVSLKEIQGLVVVQGGEIVKHAVPSLKVTSE